MTSLYEISYYGIEQHITLTLTDLARLALFVTVPNYTILSNTFTLHAGLWSSGMTLASYGKGPWFEAHTILSSIGYFFYCLQCFVFFALFFP